MRVTIDIPKEFEEHWKNDRFEDSLNRLKADAHCLAGNYEKETIDMLIKAFNTATDVVEIIRCKDCVHRHQTTCPFLIANTYRTSDYDDYCSRGERRDNE